MENDDLSEYLNALDREDCYRVDRVLKESPYETTQQVSFVGANGAVRGPFIRKFISRDAGIGGAYERLFAAQQSGRRFKYLPHILECYATADHLVVVMEYAPGETLQDAVERKGASVEFARVVFPMLCDAVSELHEGFNPPIIHRDLKPSNIVLAEGGLTIIDFGIARDLKVGAESDTTHFGTRPYAPPEQFGFGQTTERSDVYALGKILSYCVTGVMANAGRPEPDMSVDVSPQLHQVITKATSFAPEMRFASARSLKRAFERASGLSGSPGAEGLPGSLGLSGLSGSSGSLGPSESTGAPSSLGSSGSAGASSSLGAEYVRSSEPVRMAQAESALHANSSHTAPQNMSYPPASPPGVQNSQGGYGQPHYSAQPHPNAEPQPAPQKRSIGGEIWNVLVAIFTLALIVQSIGSISNPAESVAGRPFYYIVIFYAAIMPFTALCLGFLVLDKRRLKVRFPWLAKVKWWYVLAIWAVVFVGSSFVIGAMMALLH